jgi:hypothetical protein
MQKGGGLFFSIKCEEKKLATFSSGEPFCCHFISEFPSIKLFNAHYEFDKLQVKEKLFYENKFTI